MLSCEKQIKILVIGVDGRETEKENQVSLTSEVRPTDLDLWLPANPTKS